jgi:hypothetical protein
VLLSFFDNLPEQRGELVSFLVGKELPGRIVNILFGVPVVEGRVGFGCEIDKRMAFTFFGCVEPIWSSKNSSEILSWTGKVVPYMSAVYPNLSLWQIWSLSASIDFRYEDPCSLFPQLYLSLLIS